MRLFKRSPKVRCPKCGYPVKASVLAQQFADYQERQRGPLPSRLPFNRQLDHSIIWMGAFGNPFSKKLGYSRSCGTCGEPRPDRNADEPSPVAPLDDAELVRRLDAGTLN